VQGPYGLVAIAIGVFVVGLFLHFTPDNQKPTAQSLQPERLITTGMMARSRNPYSFGELLIYLALLAMLAMHWLPLVVPLGYVILVWGPNMRRKDRSLAPYAEFDAYRRGTQWFIPLVPWCGPSAIRQLPRLASLRRQRSPPGRALGRVASPGIAPPGSHSAGAGGKGESEALTGPLRSG